MECLALHFWEAIRQLRTATIERKETLWRAGEPIPALDMGCSPAMLLRLLETDQEAVKPAVEAERTERLLNATSLECVAQSNIWTMETFQGRRLFEIDRSEMFNILGMTLDAEGNS